MEASGNIPSFLDRSIALIAVAHGLILVSASRSDFRLFKGLKRKTWGGP